jgi:hypothetical protein
MLRDYCLIVADEAGDDFEMHGLVQLSGSKHLGSRRLLKNSISSG